MLYTYTNIAAAGYEDSAASARALQDAVQALTNDPSPEALQAAKEVWLKHRHFRGMLVKECVAVPRPGITC
ncbi:imelysin family protein [Roseovarius sp. Pro17]|uniref:imelysin family protein n=1 Tax=Roseovarius sp. Pro17 TaxID=3108175 RepID=UPI002D77C2A6|nr:imelysin family protein [Roseovarius sp. Pro17]